MHDARSQCLFPGKDAAKQKPHPNWKVTEKDVKYIIRGASLIVRREGIFEKSKIPYNLYSFTKEKLSTALLDSQFHDCGEYLLYKHCCQEGLFNIS